MLSEETIKKVLKDFGLTATEAEVYLFLSKHGVLKGAEIARQIKKDKAQVYHLLKSLQAKGLVESTLEVPVRFAPIPFENIVESTIKAKRDEAARIESTKQELFTYWTSLSKTKLELPLEKFTVIQGRDKVYSKISQMIAETKSQLSTVTTVTGLLRANQFGLYDAVSKHPRKSQIQFRFLTELSSQNLNGLKTILSEISETGFSFRGRTPDLGLSLFSRMVIRDNEETLFFITPRTVSSNQEHDDLCLWTNCKSLVDSFTAVFEELWLNSTDIVKKITEIEADEPILKTSIIEDALTAKEKSEQEETLVVTSSKGLMESSKNIRKHVISPKTKWLSAKRFAILVAAIVAIVIVASVASMPLGPLFHPLCQQEVCHLLHI